ncbi:HAD-IIIC family phosphatase [Actinokineospora sp. NBRC 105648]|uniref:HAD-IIIC family phosphatase n=1 Tax=Actinokineospora sp. NBRC 105648 TaxID=3032206 RepID=UPI0024A41230|nr:HAD-IIIC family phosphatase [Actinokineospora sp. NBRC 105648]GLZ39323.1 HAD-superfamily phosphatase, subfamily IIIC:FkbH [Actinokineospora sp. NBRC 105648]
MSVTEHDPVVPPPSRAAPVAPSVLVAATFACDPLTAFLRDALTHTRHPHPVAVAPYGQVAEQFLLPHSAFARNTDGVNVTLVRPSDWAPEVTDRAAAFIAAVTVFAAPVPTLVVLCPDPPGATRPEVEDLVNNGLRAIPEVAVVRAADWFAQQGCANPHDPQAAAIAHLPYTDEAFAALAVGIIRVAQSLTARPKKVIAIDCDHTLWGGACGDLPPGELDLGERYLVVQRFLKAKRDQGFLLAVCSRNDPAAVERVFAERTDDLVLERADFVATRVNWSPKWTNLVSLADELRLGVDSFVLVDDDPYVCAETTAALPEVTVVQLPPDRDARAILDDTWELDRFFTTTEDRLRNATYLADARRAEVAAITGPEELNARLGTDIRVRRADAGDTGRIRQLLARTNQFTSATVGAASVRDLLDSGATAWLATMSDRFGDYGTVAAALTLTTTEQTTVECFAMSCRVLGRGVAEALFNAVAADGRALIRFRETGRNGVAREFLTRYATEDNTGPEPVFLLTGTAAAARTA